MKKLPLIAVIACGLAVFSGCAREKTGLPAEVRVAALKCPSSIGMIKLIDEAGEISANSFSFEILASPDEIVPKIVQGKLDIAAVPPNLSSVLHNNTQGKVRVIAVSTLGMMYIVEKGETIASIEDLRGKTIDASFKGMSPEYDLNYILNANGINPETDITIEWRSEHAQSVAALAADKTSIAALPQPFAAAAQMLDGNIRIALDMNKEWEKLQKKSDNPGALISGVIIARAEFIEKNPAAVSGFLDRYAASVEFVNNNTGEAAALAGKYNIIPADVAQKAIPYCNITFIEGIEMKEKLSGYFRVLFEQNPQSVGGALPSEAFYFIR